ncbi:hypothetical protein [Pseudokineococcus sp. 1T1Z-3]|uniref:hypothetical protein n=1 Tax=Pseudokineococcus sp. 1T1Z-3 TaxID=3132745 RepID=UPI00309741E9
MARDTRQGREGASGGRGGQRRHAPETTATPRVLACRARVEELCAAAVEQLQAAGVPHDATHASVRHVVLLPDVLTVHGTGWDLGRYALWPDGTLREVGERIGWVDEDDGRLRLRSDARVRTAGDGEPAPRGGVWATCALVPHVDVDAVGARTGVVVAADDAPRWADHPRGAPGRGRRGRPQAPARPTSAWPDLAADLAERVRRRTSGSRGAARPEEGTGGARA